MDGLRETTQFEVLNKVEAPVLPYDPTPKPFKVLLVYPNYSMVNLLPTNIGVLTACLKRNGFQVDLFDTTFYRTSEKTLDEIRVENLQVRKFNLEEFGVKFKPGDYLEDFRKKVAEFKPDLIGVTVVEDTWPQAKRLIEAVRDYPAPVIVGGVFPTLAPEIPMRSPDVDMICVGEGEYAIVDLALRMWRKQDHSTVKNLWVKKNGDVVKNPMNPPIPMDMVPFGEFDLFEKERFFRPMQGKIMRMGPIETDRGCPYKCRFCEAPSLVNIYRENTGQYYFRRRSWSKVREEILEYIEKYGVNYIYFNSETFLAMSEKEFDGFIEMYRDIKLPFWMQTRIETLNTKRIRGLEEVNCNRISIGLEHGNEEFRNKIVGKGFSNERLVEVFKLFTDSTIPITVNNILGFPGETREYIFDTIELNRRIGADSFNAYYFTPYHGTAMRKDAVDKGYVSEDAETGTLIAGSVLNMPTISRDEIMGLVRTFSLYVKFPKEEWPDIAVAEKFTPEGNAKFEELSKRYYERFFDHDFKYTRKACISTRIYDAPAKSVTEDITN
ncbi:MAG: B12-binding domain-containing radical SAM protein [Nitrospirae bacterium]|nr:MAG: B12-binding domain-containing radical SAM protein [Nitrospirota bacterium]